jgi:two-component system, NarL family, nitrate/nitrite response regulator NarL
VPTRGSSARSQTTVFVVADVRIYREGLAESLSTHPQLTVLGTSASRADAREQVRQLRPHVVLIDIATRESLELIGELRAGAAHSKVLALAAEKSAPDIIECAEAGASGYVSAEASMDDLVKAIERITDGELVCPPQIAAKLFGRISHGEQLPMGSQKLTSRERQVLNCIRQGNSNKEIGHTLNISEATVKNHVHHLLEKLSVTTRAQAALRSNAFSARRRALATRRSR